MNTLIKNMQLKIKVDYYTETQIIEIQHVDQNVICQHKYLHKNCAIESLFDFYFYFHRKKIISYSFVEVAI